MHLLRFRCGADRKLVLIRDGVLISEYNKARWKNEKTVVCLRPTITYSGHPHAPARGETLFFL